MSNAVSQVIAVAVAIVGLAILAVIVSRNSQTPQVIEAAGKAFTGAIAAAVSPITVGSGFTGSAPGYPNIY
jgi:VIT1/CCC1 family predicted Fe2+/Mn2+ transporter